MDFLEQVRAKEHRGDRTKLADLLGTSKTTVGKMLDGVRPLRLEEIRIIADYYSIIGYAGDRKMIRIDGIVGAGCQVHPIDDDGLDDVEAPPGVTDEARALLVRGDSMIPAFYDGDVVIYDHPRPWGELARYAGEECVVKTDDGRRAVKVLVPGKDIRRWTLYSYNAEPWVDVLLEWAAPVVWTRRAPRKLRRGLPQPMDVNMKP